MDMARATNSVVNGGTMNRVKVGVALGMIAALVVFFLTFDLAIAGCISDESCNVGVRLLGVITTSGLAGLVVGWVVARLHGALESRRRKDRLV